jgi:hypothetical protein
MTGLTLRAADLEATFIPGAGMLGCSPRHRGEELLGEGGGLEAYVAQRKTMGIPLLHPWANRLSRGASASAAARSRSTRTRRRCGSTKEAADARPALGRHGLGGRAP